MIPSNLMMMMFGRGSSVDNILNFRLARSVTTTISQSTTFDLNITTSRTTGPAPLGVVFNALTNSLFPGIARPAHELSFWWDFGGTDTFTNIPSDHPHGNNANTAMGAIVGHVFAEGTHTVKLMVYDHVTGDVGYAEQDIVVSNADIFFAATKTIVWDNTDDWTGEPVGSTRATSLTDALDLLNVNGDRRLLIKAGTTETLDSSYFFYSGGNHQISTFGTGDNAVLNADTSFAGGILKIKRDGVTIFDVDFTGNYDPETGTGESYDTQAIYIIHGTGSICNDFTMWHCNVSGLSRGFSAGGSEGQLSSGDILVQDNNFTDWHDYGLFAGRLSNFVTRGNSIKQNINAISGTNGKADSTFSEQGTGSKFTYTHGINLYSDAATNLIATKRDRTTGAVTVLVKDVDYTYTETTVTYTTAPTSNEDAYMYHARWANHGPYRNPSATEQAIIHNDLLSNTAWDASGLSRQPCIRNNTDGVPPGQASLSFINSNRCEGGIYNIHHGHLDNTTTIASDAVIEQNYCVADSVTEESIGTRVGGGITIRNNVLFRGNFPYTRVVQFDPAISYGAYTGQTDAGNLSRPIRIYNNTILITQTTANGVENCVSAGVGGDSTVVDGSFTDKSFGNNLQYSPYAPTPITDYSPIDLNNYGALLDGSPALDAGTHDLSIVWDDFFGNVRGENTSIGAGDLSTGIYVPSAPIIGTLDLPEATVGEAYSYTVPHSGDTPTSGTLETGTVGNGITFNTSTWTFEGTPTADTDMVDLSVSLTNSSGTSAISNVDDLVVNAAPSKNKLVDTEDLSTINWTKSGVTIAGTDTLDEGTSDGFHSAHQAIAAPEIDVTETLSFDAENISCQYVGARMLIDGVASQVVFNLYDGTIKSETGNFTGAATTFISTGKYRCQVSMTGREEALIKVLHASSNGGTLYFTGTNRTSKISRLQLEDGASMTAYVSN